MALNNRKILDTDVTTKGVVAAPNILKGSAQQNKAIFDRLIREIVKERLNALIDDLTAVTAAGELGASVEGVTGNTVQAVLSAIKAEVDTKAGDAGVTAKLALKADKADTDLHFKAIGFDAATGTFTFTRENGTSVEVDTALEKVAVNFTYDATTEELVLTLADGSTQRISLAALISVFDFVDSSTVAFGVSGGTVTAQVKAGSITDEMLSTALVDYLEGLVSDAESSEIAAAGSAQSAASAEASASSSASTAASAAASARSSASSAASARSSASAAAGTATSKANSAQNAADAAENSSNVAARAAASAAISAKSADGAAKRYPYIDGESGNWMVWDTSQGAFVDTGVPATGADGEDGKDGADGQPGSDGADGKDGATFTPSVSDSGVISWTNDKGLPNPTARNITGPQGVPGADGKDGAPGQPGADGKDGQDGYSPTVATQAITGGTEITITDKNGDHVFDVMDGAPGQDGADGRDGSDGAPGQPGADGTKWFSGGTEAALYAAEATANVGDYFLATADFFPEVWDTTSGPAIMWVSKGDVLYLVSKEHEHHWDATGNNIIGPKGDIGPAGPNFINGSTSTTLTGVLLGNGSNVAVQAVDTTPTGGSGNLITSGGVQAAIASATAAIKAASDLANYYTKSQTYTQAEVNALVSAIPKFAIEVVQTLPTTGISDTTVYLVPSSSGETQNLYDEYIHTTDGWEKLGTQTVDLTGYATEAWVTTQLGGYLKTTDIAAWAKAAEKPTYSKSEVGLGNVDNTSDASKPISADTQAALDGKEDAPTIVTMTAPTAITLADNTEYYLSNVSDLTISYPTTGHWEVWITLDTASDGTVTVTLPAGSRYIGAAPDFGVGESWEISIRDGVVVAGKAEAVT